MDLDQIAQRLEELAVDLDSEELQGLADALGTVDGKCNDCSYNRGQNKQMKKTLEEIQYLLHRTVGPDQKHYHDEMTRRAELEFRQQMWATRPKNMSTAAGLTQADLTL